jgi:hypothetical protein
MLKNNKSFLVIMGILINIPLFFIPAESRTSNWYEWNECEGDGGGRTYYSYKRDIFNQNGIYQNSEFYISRRNHKQWGGLAKEKTVTGVLGYKAYSKNWSRKCE